jgi:transcription elongation factor SPT6
VIALSGSRNSDDASELLRLLEIEFINAVNDVGIDLNRCNISPHTSGCLQFVCGLGPRKAQHILKILRQQRSSLMNSISANKQHKTYPVAINRLFLVTKCSVGRRVLINCAGFVKFDVDKIEKEIEDDDENDDEIEILDSTRIHPETYEWARKMAVDALDFEDNNDSANYIAALKEIVYENSQKRLKDLDLDAFAAELERTGHGNKITTLYDIRSELMKRYRDKRTPYAAMNEEERFYALIKETPATFYVGKLIMCRVVGIARKRPTKEQLDEANPIKDDNTLTWTCSFCKRNDFEEINKVWRHFDDGECSGPAVGVRTQLDNGCNGFIPLRSLSDNQVSNPEERIKVGMIVHARIRRIDVARFSVELTTKTSDLRDVDDKLKLPKDAFYDLGVQNDDQAKLDDKKKREEHKKTYTKRVIAHPQFKNLGYQQAVGYLRDVQIGEAVIRPSSKGNDHLTVTWKIDENLYQHIDVLEEKKMNAFSVGKKLIIDGEEFEDLDEILACYVNPMANYVREIRSYKYFRTARDLAGANDYSQSQTEVDESKMSQAQKVSMLDKYFTDERYKNPSKTPYIIISNRDMPGKFSLCCFIKDKMRQENITVTPKGLRFRQKMFRTLNELISWFKVHFNEMPPPPPSQPQLINNISMSTKNLKI